MFKNLKLLAMMVGVGAVLVGLMAMPGVTQQESPLSRQNIVKVLDQAFVTLTASEGDIFDTSSATFYSDAGSSLAVIPLHYKSRSLTLMDDLMAGKAENVTLGAVYVAGDLLKENKDPFLKKGVYIVKALNPNTAAFVNEEGREIFRTQLTLEKLDKPVPIPITTISVKEVRFIPQQQSAKSSLGDNGADPLTIKDQIVIIGTCCRTVQGRSCFLWWCWTFEYEVCETCIIVINPGQLVGLGSLPAQPDQLGWVGFLPSCRQRGTTVAKLASKQTSQIE